MLDLGIVRPGSTVRFPFATYDSNDPSASVTATGFAATDVEIYKDGSTTQRASDNGYTATTDFDSLTGLHVLTIDLADNTTAGFFAAGSEYLVAVSSITVDSGVVSFWAGRFRIGYPDAILNTTIASLSSQTSFTLTTGPAEDDALNGQWAVIHDVASAVQMSRVLISDYTGSTKTVTLAAGATFTAAASDNFSVMGMAPLQPTTTGRTLDVSSGGEAGVDWGNVGSPTTTVGLSGTTIATSQAIASVSGAVGSVTGNVGGNVAGSVGSVTGNVGGNVTGSVGSLATQAKADVNAEVDAALADIHLDHLLAADYDPSSKPGTSTALLNELVENDGGVSRFTANSLEQAPSGSGANPLVVASGTIGATGNDTTHLHLTGLTYGDDELNNLLIVVYDDSASEYHSAWITDWADTGDLATVTALPFTPEDSVDTYNVMAVRRDMLVSGSIDNLDDLYTSLESSHTGIAGLITTVDTVVDAIKVKTDYLPSATAGSAGGVFIAGTNASLTVTGTATLSDGLIVSRSSSNSSAIVATGNGTGSGIRSVGGATGHGAYFAGGATSGDGIASEALNNGYGLSAAGGPSGGAGIRAVASSSGWYGLFCVGSGSGAGIQANGGSTGNGLNVFGNGGAAGFAANTFTIAGATTFTGAIIGTNASNDLRVNLADGSHGGSASTLTLSRVIVSSATSNEPAVKLTGNGTGAGLHVISGSGSTGNAIYAVAASTNGHAFRAEGVGTGSGVYAVGGNSSGAGMAAVGGTTGYGLFCVGSSVAGLYTNGVTGDINGNLSGSVGSVATGGITAASIANGAIDAATFAADVDAEIRSYVGLGAANLDTQLNTIYTDVGTGLTHLTDIKGGTFNESTDSLEAIRDRGDSAWITSTLTAAQVVDEWESQSQADPTGFHVNVYEHKDLAQTQSDLGGNLNQLQARMRGLVPLWSDTIGDTGNDATHLHLAGLTYGDDEINNLLLTIYDASEDEYHFRWIEDWVASTKLATVATLPFTPEDDTDSYWVTAGRLADSGGVTTILSRVPSATAAANIETVYNTDFATNYTTANVGWVTYPAGYYDQGQSSNQPWPDNLADFVVSSGTGRVTVGTNADKTGYSVSGTTTTLDALQTALNSAHGSGSWATATGFSTLDAAGVRSAVGLATANLDNQLADLPTVAEFEARTLVAANYFDPAADTVANVTTVATLTGHTAQTGDCFARLGAPAGASVSADIAAAKADTAAILADTGTDGVVVAAGSKAGYALSSTGLDLVMIDGKTLPAAIQIVGAVVAGDIDDAGTGTETFVGFDGATTRATATVDEDGNRTWVYS